MRIPPGRIVRRGKINQELWDIIVANSRMPFTVSNDFSAFLAGLRVAKQRMGELCDRYGGATVTSVMRQSIETSESSFALAWGCCPTVCSSMSAISTVRAPPATPLLVKVHCRMEKRRDTLTFDFDGSDPQTATYGMATRAGTVGAVATVMLCLFGSGIAWITGRRGRSKWWRAMACASRRRRRSRSAVARPAPTGWR